MSESYYQAQAYLGQHPRVSEGILKKTACMGESQRLAIADLEAIKEILPTLEKPDLSLNELIDCTVKVLSNEGYALWPRDPISDMAIKKGDTTVRVKVKKRGEVDGNSPTN